MPEEKLMDVQIRGGVLVVSLRTPSVGALSGVEQIADELRGLVRLGRPSKMIIDFSRAIFFSSKMLGLLVDIWKRLKDCGGVLVVSGINPQLTRVFKITSLDRIFEFYADVDAALKALAAGGQ